jgi:hypothetical protein
MRSEYIAPVLSGIANLQNFAQQWYLDKGVTWPPQPPVNKIDIHHHFVPDFYAQGEQIFNPLDLDIVTDLGQSN